MNELFYKTDQCGIRCPKRRNYDFANMQSAPNQYNMCCFYKYVATTFKLVGVSYIFIFRLLLLIKLNTILYFMNSVVFLTITK